eukprot:TRINITY_DN8156_c0_g2_i2.p1 TRINITY_DN8156_c0_g2~~TRINITY_DN8156_c0_g2_i2.p1  ORF type:complete len:1712 (+),score=184.19 TRINITY_DN8156_c0_g2_i2:33-5138(+)
MGDASLLLLLFLIPLCLGQDDNPLGFSGLSFVNVSRSPSNNIGIGGLALDTVTGKVLVGASNAAFRWDPNLYSRINTSSVVGSLVPNGIWIDVQLQWSSSRRALLCYTSGSNSYIYEYNIDAGVATRVFTRNTTALTACVMDFRNEIAWLSYSTKFYRVPMGAPGTQWTNPDPSIAESTVQKKRTYVGAIDSINNYAYFGSADAVLYRLNLSYMGPMINMSISSFTVGAGNIQSLGIDNVNNRIYLGTEFGLGFVYSLGTFGGNYRLFYVPGSQVLQTMLWDASTNTSFWGTSQGNLYRINDDNFNQPFDSLTINNCTACGITPVQSITAMIPLTSRQALIATSGTPARIAKINLYDCSLHTTCDSCATTDAVYCGWCLRSNTCTDRAGCSGSPYLKLDDGCPTILSSSPSSGASLGHTNVTITVTLLNPDNTQCAFGGIVVPATVLNSNTVLCTSPPQLSLSSVPLSLMYLGANYTSNSVTWSYYDCTGNCSTCLQTEKPDCGFCLDSGECTIGGYCNVSHFWQDSCPIITSISPQQGVDQGGTLVSITADYFPQGASLQCRFGDQKVEANVVNATLLTCTAPPAQVNGYSQVLLSVVYSNSTSDVYATYATPFVYYNCDLSHSCKLCLTGLCQWCTETSTCSAVESTTTCSNTTTLLSQCPVLSKMSPESGYTMQAYEVSVTSNFFTEIEATSYSCQWSDIDDSNFSDAVSTNATYINASIITCESLPQSPGTSYLRVMHGPALYAAESLPFQVYDCEALSCRDCLVGFKEECGWALQDALCGHNVSERSACPTLDAIFPSQGHLQGGTLVTVSVSDLVNATYECSFGGIVVPATLSDDEVQCVTPPSSIKGSCLFQLLRGGQPYTLEDATFQYFDCSDFSGNCSECVAQEMCSFCVPFSCQEMVSSINCSSASITRCPALTAVIPDHLSVKDPRAVTIEGVSLVDPALLPGDGEYTCQVLFNNTVVMVAQASWDNETSLSCLFQAPIMVKGFLALSYNGSVFANDLPIEFYDCDYGQSQANCSVCHANPSSYCGWCLDQFLCGPEEGCLSYLWQKPCPAIASVTPDYASPYGNTTLTIEGQSLFEGLDLRCQFGEASVPVEHINSSVLSCVAPPQSTRKRDTSPNLAFSITLNGKPFASNTLNFQYLDCLSQNESIRCGVCKLNLDPRCEWCPYQDMCAPVQQCSSLYPVVSGYSLCPALTRLDPVVGSIAGGLLVHLTGVSFINSTDLQCSFGGDTVPASYVNATRITCMSPRVESASTVEVSLLLGQSPFVDNNLVFQYQLDDVMPTSSVDVNLIIGVTVAGVVIVIAVVIIVVAVLVVRRRPKKIVLTEPRYDELAFAGAASEFPGEKEKGMISTQVMALQDLLLGPPHFPLFTAICETAQISDMDSISKALTYLSSDQNKALALLKHFVSLEVKAADSDTSLFRANSVVCKMTSFYSKLVGLPYLWKTLALAIHELNDLGKGDYDDNTKYNSEGMTSIMSQPSMEVDPNRLEEGEDEKVNQIQLQLMSQKLFAAITKSVDNLPPQLRELMAHLREEVSAKFPEQLHKVLGGFIFLRFICPSILAPHVYGLLPEPPNQDCQRCLILLSKTLQNLALGTLPGKKEPFMLTMNDFITQNLDAVHAFLEDVARPEVNGDEDWAFLLDIPPQIKVGCLNYIHRIVISNAPVITAYLEEAGETDISEQISQVLQTEQKEL